MQSRPINSSHKSSNSTLIPHHTSMPKKRNPYLSPQDIASLLSPPPQESLPLPPTTPSQLPQTSISTALSNTLVIDLIFGKLSEADIRTCLKVCTAWNNLAQPHFWKSIAHYYIRRYYDYDDCCYYYYDPISSPTFRWWEIVRDHWWLDTFGRDIDLSTALSHSSSVSSSSRSKASTLIDAKQRELICRNAFRVKSLRIDYSASSLLDVPFMNLIRLSLSCRHSHTAKTASWNFTIAGGLDDQRLKGVALELIAGNPRLRELELSYVEEQNGWYANNTRLPQMSFAIRVLQVLQHHQLSLSSSSSINNNNNNNSNSDSGLYSLKLIWTGDPTMNDICTIFENCPPSLKELTIHTHEGFYSNLSTPDPQVIQKRFADLKNNNYPITANNSPYRQRTPNLRLLNVAQHMDNRTRELETRDPETTFFPMLACFPDIQDLFLPKLSYEWTINRCAELITILTTSCLALTSINFGENFIEEEHMFCFLMALPEGQLRGITMKIRPNFLTRVVPTLLERSRPASVTTAGTAASTLEVIYLYEQDFERHHFQQRSKYILEFLASCPCLKTLGTVPASRLGSHADTSSYFELQLSDLMQKEWICSKLETLSIGILKLTVAIYSPSEYQGLDESNIEEDTTLQKITAPDDAQLSKYRRKIQALTSFYLRLKNSLPYLKTLDLKWSESHNNIIPFDCAVEYSKGVLTIARLRWMGLSWWTIHGLETATVQEAYRGLSESERNMFSKKKMQEKGITVYRQKSGCQRCQRGAWGPYGCADASELDWRWYENNMNWHEPVFEDLADAYKSRSIRRLHEETKRRK